MVKLEAELKRIALDRQRIQIEKAGDLKDVMAELGQQLQLEMQTDEARELLEVEKDLKAP